MADLYLQDEARDLLNGKKVVIIGDSNMRALYKDLVCLLYQNNYVDPDALKLKQERQFCNDKRLTPRIPHNGRSCREDREYKEEGGSHTVNFYFVTHCYDDVMEQNVLKCLKEDPPDVVIMNSCLWDISRWGPNGVDQYKENLVTLMKRLKEILPPHCLFIWTTTMPVSQNMKGGFLIAQVEFLRHQMRFEIMEANFYAWKVVTESGYDVLDLHYYMQTNIHRRCKDGVHWMNTATRHVTNYVLTHIALAWGVPMPGRIKNGQLERAVNAPLIPELPPVDYAPAPPPKRRMVRPFRRQNDPR